MLRSSIICISYRFLARESSMNSYTLFWRLFLHCSCHVIMREYVLLSTAYTVLYIVVHLPSFVLPVKVAQPTEILRVLNSSQYNKYGTPTQDRGIDEATEITIGIYVEGMSSIRAQTMDFHIDIYFEQRWVDTRLKHGSKYRVLIKDMTIYENMWHPDLYFANANRAESFDVTAPNFLLWIFPNGTVHHECRLSLTVLCNMHLGKYPLDTQECNMRILSYAYTSEQLNITWRGLDPIILNADLLLPDMHIVSYNAQTCNGEYVLGTWSCVMAVFKLEREIMHHVLQSYIPTILIVVISWFSFWLDIDAVPGRVSLCITTLLTLATQASSARLSLPQVSYAKAIDVWMEACLGFVFLVLIEFTVVNYVARLGQTNHNDFTSDEMALALKEQQNSNGERTMEEAEYMLQPNDQNIRFSMDAVRLLNNALDYRGRRRRNVGGRRTAMRIDKVSRVLFPALFFTFNIVYWPYYVFVD